MLVTGDNLQSLRRAMPGNMTQQRFADALGVSRSYLAMMESGTKPISGEIESRAMTLASVGFVSERRKTYGDDAAIKQVTQFLIDFLAEPDEPSLIRRAADLLKRLT